MEHLVNMHQLFDSVPVFSLQFVGLLAAVVWLDLLLSGDNAVVIALVARGLPKEQQKQGMIFGVGAAIFLRIVMSFFAAELIQVPGLRLVGGVYLIWIAIGMLHDEDAGDKKPATTLLMAICLIGLADASMSLDNVLALAGLANGNLLLMVLGILISIPFVIAGAEIIKRVVDRFPLLVWAGAALLGWVAGGIIVTDPFLVAHLPLDPTLNHYFSAVIVIFILIWGMLTKPDKEDKRVTLSSGNIFDDIGVATPACYRQQLPDAKCGYSTDYGAYGISAEEAQQAEANNTLAGNWQEVVKARNVRFEQQQNQLRRFSTSADDPSTFGNLW